MVTQIQTNVYLFILLCVFVCLLGVSFVIRGVLLGKKSGDKGETNLWSNLCDFYFFIINTLLWAGEFFPQKDKNNRCDIVKKEQKLYYLLCIIKSSTFLQN